MGTPVVPCSTARPPHRLHRLRRTLLRFQVPWLFVFWAGKAKRGAQARGDTGVERLGVEEEESPPQDPGATARSRCSSTQKDARYHQARGSSTTCTPRTGLACLRDSAKELVALH